MMSVLHDEESVAITWRGQWSGKDSTATNRCLRRDVGIAGRLERLVPCTSSRTYSAQDEIRSHPLRLNCPRKIFTLRHVLSIVFVGPGVRIDELDAVVVVRVTLSTEITGCSPQIADDRSAGFDPVTYYGHQCVGGSVPYGNKECVSGLWFNTHWPLTGCLLWSC
jgi:hypothetical protein